MFATGVQRGSLDGSKSGWQVARHLIRRLWRERWHRADLRGKGEQRGRRVRRGAGVAAVGAGMPRAHRHQAAPGNGRSDGTGRVDAPETRCLVPGRVSTAHGGTGAADPGAHRTPAGARRAAGHRRAGRLARADPGGRAGDQRFKKSAGGLRVRRRWSDRPGRRDRPRRPRRRDRGRDAHGGVCQDGFSGRRGGQLHREAPGYRAVGVCPGTRPRAEGGGAGECDHARRAGGAAAGTAARVQQRHVRARGHPGRFGGSHGGGGDVLARLRAGGSGADYPADPRGHLSHCGGSRRAGGDGQAVEVSAGGARHELRRAGAWSRPGQLQRGRSARPDRTLAEADGSGRGRSQRPGRGSLAADPLRRATSADAAPRRDAAPAQGRRRRTRRERGPTRHPGGNRVRFHGAVRGDAAAQGSADPRRRARPPAGLQYDRQRRDGDRRHGRRADRHLRGTARPEAEHLRRGLGSAPGCMGGRRTGVVARLGQSQESLLPTDLLDHLGPIFTELRAGWN